MTPSPTPKLHFPRGEVELTDAQRETLSKAFDPEDEVNITPDPKGEGWIYFEVRSTSGDEPAGDGHYLDTDGLYRFPGDSQGIPIEAL